METARDASSRRRAASVLIIEDTSASRAARGFGDEPVSEAELMYRSRNWPRETKQSRSTERRQPPSRPLASRSDASEPRDAMTTAREKRSKRERTTCWRHGRRSTHRASRIQLRHQAITTAKTNNWLPGSRGDPSSEVRWLFLSFILICIYC